MENNNLKNLLTAQSNCLAFFILLFLIGEAATLSASGQEKRLVALAGYGYYEGLETGVGYNFGVHDRSVSVLAGYFQRFQKEEITWSLSTGYQQAVWLQKKGLAGGYLWDAGARAVFWKLDDPYYTWKVLALVPSFGRTFYTGGRLRIHADAGPAFNIVLYNERKTYEEAGWPYKVMPEFRILIMW